MAQLIDGYGTGQCLTRQCGFWEFHTMLIVEDWFALFYDMWVFWMFLS